MNMKKKIISLLVGSMFAMIKLKVAAENIEVRGRKVSFKNN